ncbi:MAG: sensor histidine kinase [Candidatus Hydrogenedentes bacterium]|nr:sensor histidine kinase [Candidatus Hydrogenedentota bacterium]
MFFALTLLSLLPLVSTAYQGYHCGRMVVMDLLQQHAISVAEVHQTMFTQWLEERTQDTDAIASMPLVTDCLEKILGERDDAAVKILGDTLRTVQSAGAIYEQLEIFDSTWRLVASSRDGKHSDARLVDPDFQEHVRDAAGVYFGQVHRHREGDMGTHFGRRIRDGNGETLGYLVANLNLTTSLTPLLTDRSGLWSTGAVYIVNAESRPIIGTNDNSGEPSLVPPRRDETGMGDHSGGVAPRSARHALKTIGASMPLPINDWRVVVDIDMEEAMATVRVLLYRALGMVSAALLAVVLVSLWLSRLLGSPLANLASVARKISAGHSDERLEPMHLREADEVRSAFNQMLDELRDKEAVIVRSAKLAIVGELTSRVVHEMRNPLSSIKMNLQALKRSSDLDAGDQELAEIATEQAQRLERMLNELLLYGRPVELHLEPVAVARLFESALADVRGGAEERGVTIESGLDEALGTTSISVDPDQFSRVLTNLLKNAIEASPAGARVRLCAHASELQASEIVIEVRDTGVGVRPEHQELLFKPFFTTKGNGTGLGLANVRKIVELHAGRVHAESISSGGTRFIVEMPCTSATASPC